VRHLIKLEQNYRSHGNILDAANHLISHNAHRLGKNLRTDAGHGEPVRVYEAAPMRRKPAGSSRRSAADQYRDVAQRDRGPVPQQRAVARDRARAVLAGIPYRVYGGLRFFERPKSSTRWPICA
jgi:DNA helicase-2/ATP-dependent DNA helicase PcrA